MTGNKNRGQIEAQVSESLIRFEKEYMDRGPVDIKTYIIKKEEKIDGNTA